MLIPIILAGGSGTRLWPMSRRDYPKQFLSPLGGNSLFQDTVTRLEGLSETSDPVIICNENHRFLVAEQLRMADLSAKSILLEPVGRNTAPAIACAAQLALDISADAILLVMPSDHVIQQSDTFKSCVMIGQSEANEGKLVTFGIVADRPETGYGYIKRSEGPGTNESFAVDSFVEKPDLQTAQQYINSGHYYWNSGIFLFRADAYLKELERFEPDILTYTAEAYNKRQHDMDFTRLDEKAFSSCPAQSIDYAVMEKTDRAVVIPLDAGWSDVGNWSALSDISGSDEYQNVKQGDVFTHDVNVCYLQSNHRMLAAIGLTNTIVVETADAVLVADKNKTQEVKHIVDQLMAADRCEHEHHVCVFRPWGSFETIDEGPGFKVKRIVVKPGGQLSLQKHHQRAEHWVVVKGEATVTNGDKTFKLEADQSTYIPIETQHRLENQQETPLEIIEVQTGSYLGEDDIVRFEDVYGR